MVISLAVFPGVGQDSRRFPSGSAAPVRPRGVESVRPSPPPQLPTSTHTQRVPGTVTCLGTQLRRGRAFPRLLEPSKLPSSITPAAPIPQGEYVPFRSNFTAAMGISVQWGSSTPIAHKGNMNPRISPRAWNGCTVVLKHVTVTSAAALRARSPYSMPPRTCDVLLRRVPSRAVACSLPSIRAAAEAAHVIVDTEG